MPVRRRRQGRGPTLLDFLGKHSSAKRGDSEEGKAAPTSLEKLLEELTAQLASRDGTTEAHSTAEDRSIRDARRHYSELDEGLPSESAVRPTLETPSGKSEQRTSTPSAKAVKESSSSVRVIKYSTLPLVREPVEARNGVEGYLLSTYYDGERGVVAVKLYDDRSNQVYVYYDNSGYKPYFLVDLPPDKVQEVKGVVSHPGFDHLEVVEKYDLLRGITRKLTKIVTKTPDVVRVLRDRVPKAWEANIKFHHNFIYDFQLIPGMRYRVTEEGLKLVAKVDEAQRRYVEELFKGEDRSTIDMAVTWLPLFEEAPPKAKRLAVDIEVYTPFKGRIPSASEASYPIISVALVSNDGLKTIFLLAGRGKKFSENTKLPNAVIEIFDDERALILEVFRIISNYPIVLTFNGDNFDLPYLHNRALKLNIPKELIPFRFTRDHVTLRYGIHIDLYKFFSIKAVQSYAFGNAYKEFTLDAISQALLGESKIEFEVSISDLSLSELAAYNLRDAELTLRLTTFNDDLVWKLMILLTRISRLPIEDMTRSQVSAWIKSMLYWEHRRRGYLIPLPKEIQQLKGEAKSEAIVKGKKYMGALVLDPPSGVFFNVVVLDFASLYPSIIKKWNLSYETVNPLYCPESKIVEVPDVGHKVCMSIPGLTAQIVGLLRDYRVKVYKKKAKDKTLSEELRAWYDTVQAALKVYINASYGVFGASNFPFYAPPVAESVTAIGRHTIKATLAKAAELGLKVLYGDTDSLFIWHPDQHALEELRKYVEKEFGLELEVDKVYRLLTFTGLKKNYLGVYEEGGVDIKGLVAKKRNTPEFLKREFKEVMDMIGRVSTPEDVIRLREALRAKIREIYMKLRSYEYNLDELAIHMGLNKPLSSYEKSTPPHVKAARQLVAVGIEVLPGDVIAFVKVKGKEGIKPVQLARLLEIDVDKYLEHVKSTFEQILRAFDLSWDEVIGAYRLDMFFTSRR
jgi:DNA polymerase I